MSYQYVYLIQTREFVNSKQPIYKIGKTKQINFTRFMQYPKGSVQIFQSSCNNCDVLEKNIIKRFHAKYHNCKSIGKEYFKGSARHMINDICELLLLEQQEEATESFAHEIVTDIVNDIISNVLDNVPKDVGVEPIILATPLIKIEATNELNLITQVPDVRICIPSKFSCIDCGYHCTRSANLLKHFTSRKHLIRNQTMEPDPACKHQCKVCNKKYLSQPGLWWHKKKCHEVSQHHLVEGSDFIQNFGNLKIIMNNLTELVKKQQDELGNPIRW